MVKTVKIGVLSVQGAVYEHICCINNLFNNDHIDGKTIIVKQKLDIDKIDGLIIPGGESTTISRILQTSGIYSAIFNRLESKDLAIMGTCAGCALLAKEIVHDSKDIKSLEAMDMRVERNAFGRQKESFEQKICFNNFDKAFDAVFIRAPIIREVWGDCKAVSKIDKKIIAAKQENLLAISFHPELTDDLRIHRYFLNMVI